MDWISMVLKPHNQCTSNGVWSVLNCPAVIWGGKVHRWGYLRSFFEWHVCSAVEEHVRVSKTQQNKWYVSILLPTAVNKGRSTDGESHTGWGHLSGLKRTSPARKCIYLVSITHNFSLVGLIPRLVVLISLYNLALYLASAQIFLPPSSHGNKMCMGTPLELYIFLFWL